MIFHKAIRQVSYLYLKLNKYSGVAQIIFNYEATINILQLVVVTSYQWSATIT